MLNRFTHIKLICIFVFAITLVACERDIAYFEYRNIPNTKWERSNILRFDIDPTLVQRGVDYEISLNLENNVDYLYQNIYLQIESNIDSDTILTRENKEWRLSDEDGRWLGSGLAFRHDMVVMLRDAHRFQSDNSYVIYVRHTMSDEILQGIERIGLRIREKPQ